MSNEGPSPEERLGEVIDERYRLVEHIASGGMASVYRAEHVRSREPFAVKVLYRALSDHPEVATRFQREVHAYRRIQHPHVVSAMDFGRLPDGCLYMVLEYIRGRDLCTMLYHVKPLDTARATKIALEVAEALVSAHFAGVVHRDLKPDNIMLIERGGDPDYVKVVDFGIAKIPVPGQALTALGSVFGTPEYMAPEQARGAQVDARTDLYTLGTVLYEMLSGETPFASDNLADVILAQITKPPPPLPATVDPELAAVVMQLLEKDPNQRIQTAAELVDRLRAIHARLTSPASAMAGPPAQPSRTVPLPVMPQPAAPAPIPTQPDLPAPAPPLAQGSASAAVPLYAAGPAAAVPLAAPATVTPARAAKSNTGCIVALILLVVLGVLAWFAAQMITDFM